MGWWSNDETELVDQVLGKDCHIGRSIDLGRNVIENDRTPRASQAHVDEGCGRLDLLVVPVAHQSPGRWMIRGDGTRTARGG